MELLLIWRTVKRWWWVMVIPPLLMTVVSLPQFLNRGSAVSGGFYAQFKYIAAQSDSNIAPRDGDYQDVWLASEFTVNAFTEWIRSSTFRDELKKQLGDALDLSRLNIATDKVRSIGKVEMTYPDDQQLAQIVSASITILETRNQDYFPHLGGKAAQVTILDATPIVASPPPLTNRFEPIIKIGLAALGGILLGVWLESLNRHVRYSDEIENTGVRVLAQIPKH